MSAPNYFRIEGSLSEIMEVLIKLDGPSTLSHDELFKTNNPEAILYQRFAKHMSQSERQIIEDLIQNAEYIAFVSNARAKQMELLAQTHYLLPIHRELNYVDSEFLNNYNYYILNGSSSKFPELADTAKDQNSIKYLIEKSRRNCDDLTLSEFLDISLTANQLKDICRKHKIKGFSKGPKQHIIDLVTEAFFESPDAFIEGYAKEAYPLLAYFILEERNSLPKQSFEDLNTDFWLVDTNRLNNIYFTAADVMEPIIAFFKAHEMNPLDYIRKEDRVLFQDHESAQNKRAKQTAPEQTSSQKENDFDAKLDRFLENEANITPEFELFSVLLNAYGVVPYSFATKLYNRFYNETKTEAEVKTLVSEHMQDILISDTDQFIHPILQDEYPDVLTHYEAVSYYEPTSYEALLAYGDIDALSIDKATRNAIKFFTKLVKDDDMKAIFTDSVVLQQVRKHTDSAELDQILDKLAQEPEVRKFNKLEAKRHLKKLAYYVPLWKLRGHSQAELDAAHS
ncbi:SAP domain-containing protein [Staphylococcus simulans]|uniref:SAP domain-containing protein n=1 Tax=Staphylococcus simulans TaxID=1286 RepID=UPI00399AB670